MNAESQQNEHVNSLENTQIEKSRAFEITDEIKTNLLITAKWSQFLAILGFIGMGFMVIAGVVMSVAMSVLPGHAKSGFPFPPFLLGALYVIVAAVYLFPLLYLFRFSTTAKQAIYKNNQEYLGNAFANLKSHYKTIGIIMIVFLCLYPIMILGIVLFGVLSGVSEATGFPI